MWKKWFNKPAETDPASFMLDNDAARLSDVRKTYITSASFKHQLDQAKTAAEHN